LCSKLAQNGVEVRVAFSKSAHQFISPLVFEALSGHSVYRQVFETPGSYQMEHISWARWADTIVVAPASADTIARMATGIADDAVTTLYLAFRGNVYIAPSMNTAMLDHPATQANMAILADRGAKFITPGTGALACGETGSGRMAEPLEIMEALGVVPSPAPSNSTAPETAERVTFSRPMDDSLKTTTVLITSGPTREYLDPVRFLSNPSSGKMGFALANEAIRRGATVHFVTGPVDSRFIPQEPCEVHPVETARDMLLKVQQLKAQCDLFIFAAAVGDFRPAHSINQKIKRTGNSISLPLVENPDIAQAIGFSKQPNQVTIGFAAETNDHESHAQLKLDRKHLDAIVINDVSNSEIGFNSDDNEVTIVTATGESETISRRSKTDVAHAILETAHNLLSEKNSQ
jgi:phosphopantothenoylcysteine decarboxylase/phosphopantothenate--cysteine ligase